MGSGPSHHLSEEDTANLEAARQLWEKLKGIPGLSIEEAMIHFLRLMHMGDLLALANRQEPAGRKAKGVFDVLCCGVTDSSRVTGVSSTLRGYFASRAVARGMCQRVSAFDKSMSRLSADMEADASKPGPKGRPYQSCAEHVVYEKLARLDQRANYTYAVQMVKPKSSQDFSIKVVERCANCRVAGGSSSAPTQGQPFGSTPRLGAVVTDSPAIVNVAVPVLTAPVMQLLRDTLRGPGFNDASRDAITRCFPLVRVLRSLDRQGYHRALALLGPQQELEEMYPNHHVHVEH